MLTDQYLAGLFDGEGWARIDCMNIPVGPKRPKAYRRQQLLCGIAMTYYPVIKQLYDQFGGSLARNEHMHLKDPKNRLVYAWRAASGHARDFLVLTYPYLIVKREQAELCIAFQAEMDSTRALFRQHRGDPPARERIYAHRQVLIDKIYALKKEAFDIDVKKKAT